MEKIFKLISPVLTIGAVVPVSIISIESKAQTKLTKSKQDAWDQVVINYRDTRKQISFDRVGSWIPYAGTFGVIKLLTQITKTHLFIKNYYLTFAKSSDISTTLYFGILSNNVDNALNKARLQMASWTFFISKPVYDIINNAFETGLTPMYNIAESI